MSCWNPPQKHDTMSKLVTLVKQQGRLDRLPDYFCNCSSIFAPCFFFSLIPEVDTRSFIWSFHPAFSVFVIDMSSLFYHIMFVFHPCAANFSHAVVFHIAKKQPSTE